MATHSSILAWKIPWTEEPGGLQSMGSKRVRHDWATSLVHTNIKIVFCISAQTATGLWAETSLNLECTLRRVSILTLFSSVQLLSCVQLFVTPWTAARQASLSITSSQSLLKLMSIESVMPSNHLIFCHPLLLPPSIFPSIRVFSNESVLRIRWPKYWSFSFSISPSNEYSGLISFRIDWLGLLAVQGTLKSLLQHHSSKASILQCSAFL